VGNNPVTEIDPLGLYSFDDFINDTGNLSSGFANTITFGGVGVIQGWLGIDAVVDKCSGWYQGGKYAGYAWWALAGGLRGGAEISRFGPFRWLDNNRYFRLGYGRWMKTQGRIPRVAIGTSHKLNWRLTVLGY
jgi:hypothetical protein